MSLINKKHDTPIQIHNLPEVECFAKEKSDDIYLLKTHTKVDSGTTQITNPCLNS